MLVIGLLPWLLPDGARWRRIGLVPVLMAVLVHGRVQMGDSYMCVHRDRQHLLLARNQG